MEPLAKDQLAAKYAHIKGWAIDADPDNEPTYPMKNYTGDDHQRLSYERPPLQPQTVEILKSTERPTLSATFGTSTPPSGLSGRLRRWAFEHSEGKMTHWLPLILADRINAVEGIVDDLKRGHIPNIIKERGWTGEWKYNRAGLIKKVAIGVAVTSLVVLWMSRKKEKKNALGW
ncbi:MAG TPA: hypothetical protein VHK69_14675 [Chitinophagaceae bacterium]|jgi:hypothetical protein|nr:hypothetical protein [Chitinophagaceae bacterium]